jgi:hypothetical protein
VSCGGSFCPKRVDETGVLHEESVIPIVVEGFKKK